VVAIEDATADVIGLERRVSAKPMI